MYACASPLTDMAVGRLAGIDLGWEERNGCKSCHSDPLEVGGGTWQEEHNVDVGHDAKAHK